MSYTSVFIQSIICSFFVLVVGYFLITAMFKQSIVSSLKNGEDVNDVAKEEEYFNLYKTRALVGFFLFGFFFSLFIQLPFVYGSNSRKDFQLKCEQNNGIFVYHHITSLCYKTEEYEKLSQEYKNLLIDEDRYLSDINHKKQILNAKIANTIIDKH